MVFTFTNLIQVVVALGLLNVWLMRSELATPFRGGSAKTLRDEFQVYGLSELTFQLVRTLKVGGAALLIAGLKFPMLTLPAASTIIILMLGALAMHVKAKDPAQKSVPAFVVLLLSLWIVFNP